MQRRYLFSDEQYCTLLGYLTSGTSRVIDYAQEKQLDEQVSTWLYHALTDNTYQYMLSEYSGKSIKDVDKGAVLVCFKEPALRKGAKVLRRKPTSATPTTAGLQRRCVPCSQIERVLQFCHTGALSSTMHHGQQATWGRVARDFDGISRDIARQYVKKCAVCQQRSVRKHRAALVPITAAKIYERIVIDLIDFTLKPSCGFHYILHAVDHFSKYHWAWALPDKRPATVSFHLATLLSSIGPVKHIQCDQGKEFVAEVLDVLKEFGCGPMLNSAAYHPQTNGLVERGNGMLKVALEQLVHSGAHHRLVPGAEPHSLPDQLSQTAHYSLHTV